MYAINDHIVFPNTQLVHSLNINTLKKPRVFRLTFHLIEIGEKKNYLKPKKRKGKHNRSTQLIRRNSNTAMANNRLRESTTELMCTYVTNTTKREKPNGLKSKVKNSLCACYVLISCI